MCRNKEIIFNTGETNFTLKEIYNPEESLLRKCQLRMLDMLIYIDDVCKKINVIKCNNTRTFLYTLKYILYN